MTDASQEAKVGAITGLLRGGRRLVGRAWRATRLAVDQVLAPTRRKRAARALASRQRPKHILVVCHGNICRSPYLEAALRRRLPEARVWSAGFVGPGRSVPAESRAVAGRRGLDLSAHRSQLLSDEVVQPADLVIVMDQYQATAIRRAFALSPEQVIHAGDLDPMNGLSRTIIDPWRQSEEVFETCFERLDRCAAELVRLLPAD